MLVFIFLVENVGDCRLERKQERRSETHVQPSTCLYCRYISTFSRRLYYCERQGVGLGQHGFGRFLFQYRSFTLTRYPRTSECIASSFHANMNVIFGSLLLGAYEVHDCAIRICRTVFNQSMQKRFNGEYMFVSSCTHAFQSCLLFPRGRWWRDAKSLAAQQDLPPTEYIA